MAAACEYERDEALHAAARAEHHSALSAVAARGLPVAGIDLAGDVCAARRCGVMRDGLVTFTDDNHLTASFTRREADALGQRLDAVLVPMGLRLR